MNMIRQKTGKNSFTLIEIIIVLVIIGLLATLGLLVYTHFVDKARNTEVVIAAGNIREAEIAHKIDKGEYVGAANVNEINDLLSLSINPKNYDYRVVGVSDQDFMVLVNKIDADEIIVAMNKDGLIPQEHGSSGGAGDGGISGGSGGDSGGGSGGGGGGSGEGSIGGSSGDSGGGSGSGGGSDNNGGGGDSANLGHSGGGWSNLASEGGSGALIESGLLAAFNLLKSSTAASYAYNLIEDKNIPLAFATPPKGFETAGAWWDGYNNELFVNINQQDSPASAIAALIAHESTHADYDYFPSAWVNITLQRHPELQRDDIHAPANSFDQEYNAFCNEMETWIELKGDATNSFQDDWLAAYNQGEEYMRNAIVGTYQSNGQYLPYY